MSFLYPNWWRRNFLAAEKAASVVLAAAFLVWSEWMGGRIPLERVFDGLRATFYGTAASIFGSLLGFAITAESVVIGLANDKRLALLRRSKQYPTVWKTFRSTVLALGLATVAGIVGLFGDRENAPRIWILYVSLFATLLAVVRLARCTWILRSVARTVTGGPGDPTRSPDEPLEPNGISRRTHGPTSPV